MRATPLKSRVDLEKATLAAGAVLVGAALAGAAFAAVGVRVIVAGSPRPALAQEPATVVELLAHNAVVALWPLALVATGWPGLVGARRVGDALIAGQLLAHGALVGSALAQQPGLWRWLPHLPPEWAAIALPAGLWLNVRAGAHLAARRQLATAGAVVGLLVVAAALETYAVPLP